MDQIFSCDKCDYKTKNKYYLLQHLKRKTPCNIQASITNLHCSHCNKHFKNHTSIYRHRKICNSTNINIVIKNLQAQIEDLKLIVKQGNKNDNTTNNTTNIQNNENVNVFNINIYGYENKSVLNHKEIIDILQKPGQWFTKYPKLLHFDPNYPENHNIKMTRKYAREGFIQLKKDKSYHWYLESKKKILSEKFEEIITDLQNYYDDYENLLSNYSKDNFFNQIKQVEEDKTRIVESLKQLEATIISNTNIIFRS